MITEFERVFDELLAGHQKENGLPVTVDLSKPVINENERT